MPWRVGWEVGGYLHFHGEPLALFGGVGSLEQQRAEFLQKGHSTLDAFELQFQLRVPAVALLLLVEWPASLDGLVFDQVLARQLQQFGLLPTRRHHTQLCNDPLCQGRQRALARCSLVPDKHCGPGYPFHDCPTWLFERLCQHFLSCFTAVACVYLWYFKQLMPDKICLYISFSLYRPILFNLGFLSNVLSLSTFVTLDVMFSRACFTIGIVWRDIW